MCNDGQIEVCTRRIFHNDSIFLAFFSRIRNKFSKCLLLVKDIRKSEALVLNKESEETYRIQTEAKIRPIEMKMHSRLCKRELCLLMLERLCWKAEIRQGE